MGVRAVSRPYDGPATLVLSVGEWERIHRALLADNTHEGIALRKRVRAWIDLVRPEGAPNV